MAVAKYPIKGYDLTKSFRCLKYILMTINWTTDKMKIVGELSKSIQIPTINKLQQVSHLAINNSNVRNYINEREDMVI